jgi:Rod binding domain-containing protein
MDSTNLILTQPVLPPAPLERLAGAAYSRSIAEGQGNKVSGFSEEKKVQLAKDFESVFLSKLLDEMKNTIGDWGFDKDGAAEQVQGIFWLYLARHIADNGGLGLWKNIHQFLTDSGNVNVKARSSG